MLVRNYVQACLNHAGAIGRNYEDLANTSKEDPELCIDFGG